MLSNHTWLSFIPCQWRFSGSDNRRKDRTGGGTGALTGLRDVFRDKIVASESL